MPGVNVVQIMMKILNGNVAEPGRTNPAVVEGVVHPVVVHNMTVQIVPVSSAGVAVLIRHRHRYRLVLLVIIMSRCMESAMKK